MKKFAVTALLAVLLLSGCGGEDHSHEEMVNTETTEAIENEGNGEIDMFEDYTLAEVEDVSLYDKQFKGPEKGEEIAVLKTSMGEIKLRLFPEEAPLAVENFKGLANEGFYNNVTFHRVINDFMIQTGDPSATGTGFASIYDNEAFGDEFVPYLHNYRGALSMANSGADSNGCQFFINQANVVYEDYLNSLIEMMGENEAACFQNVNKKTYDLLAVVFPEIVADHYREVGGNIHLDYKHTVFGQVFEGMDIVDKIAEVPVDENQKPLEDVVIESITFEIY